jgi:hypothetical protein
MHNAEVRTTFTPAPDIADRLRDLARRSNRSLSAVVNDLLRAALNQSFKETPGRTPFKIETRDLQPRPGYDLEHPGEILYELEIEDFLEEQARDNSRR